MKTFFDFSAPKIDGSGDAIAGLAGKTVLAVNVASECGYTPQYAGLERLHEAFGERGFAVLGFPCNQFGAQEPGTEEEIQTFCSVNYGVEFPLTRKIEVNGAKRHPVFAWLTGEGQGFPGDVKWNFEKFLVDADGRLIGRYGSRIKPDDVRLQADICKALDARP
ncbi:MAG: glutathione peroxidase [Gammaproteobacteria bacterium]|nr:glutathione peroxidase [Gammaproteobacteria bacterium]